MVLIHFIVFFHRIRITGLLAAGNSMPGLAAAACRHTAKYHEIFHLYQPDISVNLYQKAMLYSIY
jgi:hypothetical protein